MGAAVVLWVVAVLLGAAGVVLLLRDRSTAREVGVPLVAAGLLAGLAGVVYALVVAEDTLAAADAPVLAALLGIRSSGVTAAAEAVSFVGGTVGTGGAAVIAAVVLALRGRRVRAAVWVTAVAVGAATIRVAKESVERPRPPEATRLAVETTSSLPSGHSLMAALGLGLVALAVGTLTGAVVRLLVAVLAGLAVLAVGASRAYLGVHWTTDVVAGWLVGAALALLALAVARALEAVAAHRAVDPAPV